MFSAKRNQYNVQNHDFVPRTQLRHTFSKRVHTVAHKRKHENTRTAHLVLALRELRRRRHVRAGQPHLRAHDVSHHTRPTPHNIHTFAEQREHGRRTYRLPGGVRRRACVGLGALARPRLISPCSGASAAGRTRPMHPGRQTPTRARTLPRLRQRDRTCSAAGQISKSNWSRVYAKVARERGWYAHGSVPQSDNAPHKFLGPGCDVPPSFGLCPFT